MTLKRTLISLLGIAVLLQGCTDNSYRGFEEDFNAYSTPLAVQVAVGDPSAMTKSDGTGPKDYVKDFEGKEVHVWAFSRDTLADYTVTREQDTLTCLVDGYPAELDGVNSIAQWKDGRRFYYPHLENSHVKYDFFAAFLDNLPFRTERFKDRIELTTAIKGSNDVLTAKAALPLVTRNEKLDTAHYAFSYLSAEKGDMPIFTLNHGTVRIDLWVKPGIVTGNTSRVRIKEATLSSRTQATIIPAAKDTTLLGVHFKENSPYSFLPLTEEDGSPLAEYDLFVLEKSDPDAARKQEEARHHLGAAFFVSPEKEYNLNMLMVEPDHDVGYVDRDPVENLVRLKAPEATFRQGSRYVVNMTISGHRDIYIEVTMKEWEHSGSFLIDPDLDSELTEMVIVADDVELPAGETYTLAPRILLGGVPYSRDDITYSFQSQQPEIASVQAESGKISAIRPGTAWLTVTAHRPPSGDLPEGYGYKTVKVSVL